MYFEWQIVSNQIEIIECEAVPLYLKLFKAQATCEWQLSQQRLCMRLL